MNKIKIIFKIKLLNFLLNIFYFLLINKIIMIIIPKPNKQILLLSPMLYEYLVKILTTNLNQRIVDLKNLKISFIISKSKTNASVAGI